MYILDHQKKAVVNSSFVERFLITAKEEAELVNAVMSIDKPMAVIGRYISMQEAQQVLVDLFYALGSGVETYEMPDSSLQHPEQMIKDARVKRRGGS